MSGPRPVHIGLGSNLGDRLGFLAAALEALDRIVGLRVVRVSDAYETAPIGPPQPPYLNAAAELATTLSARELLERMQAIERALGRDRASSARWGPRTIDLDLLLDATAVLDEPGLTLPHPRMAERAFVLVPLATIAADRMLPARESGGGPAGGSEDARTIGHLLDRLRQGTSDFEEPRRFGPIPFAAGRAGSALPIGHRP